jgi:glycosyltransferase involved in cell wall biosynthesis
MPGLATNEILGGVRVIRVPGWRRRRHYSTALEQASFVPFMVRGGHRLMTERRYDLIHAHFVVPTGLVARRLARRHGVPYLITAHGSDVPGYNPDRFALLHRLIRPAWRSVLQDAGAITSPSCFVRGLIQRKEEVAVEILPNAFDPPVLPEAPKRRRVLAVARLIERKGIRHLIDALAALGPNAEYIIAGDGPQRATLEAQARTLGLSVTFLGQVDRDQLCHLYASSSIFVLPSMQENFPMVLLEAMSAGCAIVTTLHPGCAEVVGDAALLVPAGDSQALQEAIGALLKDPQRADALGVAAKQRAARFASVLVASQLETLFLRCVETKQ